MINIIDIPPQAILAQLLLGLMNGSFYAILSLGLAVIYGMLNIANFTHGAQYMLGAFISWFGLTYLGMGYWAALAIAPLLVGLLGAVIERLLLSRVAHLDHLYGLLLTFSFAVILQGLLRIKFGASSVSYPVPDALQGGVDFGFLILPRYRAWVIVASASVCAATWYLVEKTRLGSYLRASTENPALTQAFGINVPVFVTATYAAGVALAALAGVLAAPIYSVSPNMGADLIIVVFAVVVIGGMGSIAGSVISGFALGLIEGLTKVVYPPASEIVIFLVMGIVLFTRPAGLFGRKA